jgi:hypothetical protein
LEVTAEAESVGRLPVTSLTLLINGKPLRGREVRFGDPKLGKAPASWTIELPPGNHELKVLANNERTAGESERVTALHRR